MPDIYSFQDIPAQTTKNTISIGVFDGVHRGHQEVFRRAKETSKKLSSCAVALTFDPHPQQTIDPSKVIDILTAPKLKEELIIETGMDKVIFLKFDELLQNMEAEDFIEQIILDRLRGVAVVVGEDFRFGKRAIGSVQFLEEYLGKGLEEVVSVPLLSDNSGPIRSTRVRSAIQAGDLILAKQLMGRDLKLSGEVVHGFGRGGDVLKYPTANIVTPERAGIPANGVYAAFLYLGGEKISAAVNIGTSPTFDDKNPIRDVQAHLLDYSGDIYGADVELEFISRIRDEIKFESIEKLRSAIESDIAQITKILMRAVGDDKNES